MVIGVSIIFHLVFASSLLEFIGQRGKRTQQLCLSTVFRFWVLACKDARGRTR